MATGFTLDPHRIRSGVRGDTALILCRGLAGKNRKHVANVRSLGLYRIGDIALGYRADPSFMGKLYKSPHLLAAEAIPEQIAPRTLGGGRGVTVRVITNEHLRSAADGMIQRHIPYPDAPRDVVGNFFEFARNEYLQVEVDNSSASVLWSADCTVQQAFRVATGVLGPGMSSHGLMVTGRHAEEGQSRLIAERVLGHGEDPDLVIAGLRDALFSWRRRQLKMRDAKVGHVECAVSTENLSFNRVVEVVHELGTIGVKHFVKSNQDLLRQALGSHIVSARR